MNRRKFLCKTICTGPLIAATFWLSGCRGKSKDACSDISGLTESDKTNREAMGYVAISPIPNSTCGNCQLWLPPEDEDACGGCQLFKGPVPEEGFCTYWAPHDKDE
ncbi:high-potential iron-sulfur protein [Dyadobacter sandarakinus]|uniref:High-potential iron-sulfur protein n=1 Tax=Dyadobacter sandarakinus TaxID=2747268 RepID=A0ABX7IGH8_9BACT|nr:high-potential iron-sulfur protein [Dyadobacter sandarakinus]